MKKALIGILLLSICWTANGQQTPQYTQYMLNYFALNPALAGTRKCMDMKVGYRQQWLSYDGAPRTAFMTLHTPLKLKKGSVYTKHGIGAKVESDFMGLTSTTKIYLAYAYHFPFNARLKASVGVFGGIQQFKFKVSDVFAINGNDPAINAHNPVIIYPDFTPGFFLHNEKVFGGLSVRNLLLNKIKNYGTGNNRFKHHFELLGGMNIEMSDDFSYVPSVLIKVTPWSAPALDINLLAEFRQVFSFGLSYRNTDALAAMVKFNIKRKFTIGYSFDLTTSKIRHVSSNTHEVVLGLFSCPIGDGDSYSCPVFE